MNNLPLILAYLYPEAQWFTHWQVSADESGSQYISFWNYGEVPQPTMEQLQANEAAALAWQELRVLKDQARQALNASDITVLRLIEMNSTLVPEDWKTYRTALRDIISAAASTTPAPTMPVRPAYPADGE